MHCIFYGQYPSYWFAVAEETQKIEKAFVQRGTHRRTFTHTAHTTLALGGPLSTATYTEDID